MKEIIKLNKSIELKENISEITSISLESIYNSSEFGIDGTFDLTGTYKNLYDDNDISFEEKIPFTYDFLVDIDLESINITIEDFTYDIDKNMLNIHVDYEVEFNKIINDRIEEIPEIKEEKQILEEKVLEEENIIETKETCNEKYITYKIHVAKEEETLSSICTKYNVDVDEIRKLNQIEDIFPGIKIIIPINNE